MKKWNIFKLCLVICLPVASFHIPGGVDTGISTQNHFAGQNVKN